MKKNSAAEVFKTIRVRIKDKHAPVLRDMARQVNQIFNFCNETSLKAIRDRNKWLSGYDLQKLVSGYSKCEGVTILADTASAVCAEYACRRQQRRKARLNWRVSNPKSPKYSLGWIPFKAESTRYRNGQIEYKGCRFGLWDSYGLAGYEFRSGNFSEDSRGRWYFNLTVKAKPDASNATSAVGIDLGLKTAITVSDGQTFDGRLYRASEKKLATAQRAGKKRQAKAIHAKIKNQRKDGLHKFSTALVKQNAAIFVGDVASAKLVKTKMAKSALDAGWSIFKTMLEYKSHLAGSVFEVVNESYTTQTCSQCGSVEGPKGVAGLGIREWRCSCGAVHDRDVNAAKVILARGLTSLAEGACHG